MVKISDCSCECRDKGKEKKIEERALSSINKILGTEGQAYYPDGTGAVTIPIADADQLAQIGTNAEDIAALERAQEKMSTDIGQMKISITENATEIEKIQAVNDAQAREITGIKADDGSRDTEIAGLKTRVTATEGDISDIQTVDAGQTSEINSLKTKTAQQATQISGLDALCESITKSLVTDVEVGVGTDAGSFIVSVVEEDGTKRSSDSFQYGRVGTFALMQGAQAGYVRGVLTLVDGTKVESNDFQILQVTASDVYVTSITLSADYQTGKIGGTIGYSNGNSAAINEILVPTAPGVTSNINDLLGRMTAVETKDRTQDASISDLTTRVETLEATPGIGKFTNSALGTIQGSTADGKVSANSDGTGSVNGWSTIKSDIASKASQSALSTTNAEVATKASKTELSAVDAKVATKASQADLTALQNSVKDCFNDVDYDSASGTLTLTALDGQSNSITINKGVKIPQTIFTYDRRSDVPLTNAPAYYVNLKNSNYGGTINGTVKQCSGWPGLFITALDVPSVSSETDGYGYSSFTIDDRSAIADVIKANLSLPDAPGLVIIEYFVFTTVEWIYRGSRFDSFASNPQNVSNSKIEAKWLLLNIASDGSISIDSRSTSIGNSNNYYRLVSSTEASNGPIYKRQFSILSIAFNPSTIL